MWSLFCLPEDLNRLCSDTQRVDSPSRRWRMCSLGGPRGYRSTERRRRRAGEGLNRWSQTVEKQSINPDQRPLTSTSGQINVKMGREQVRRHELTQRSRVFPPLCRLWPMSQTLRWQEKTNSQCLYTTLLLHKLSGGASLPVFRFSSDKLDHAP